MILVAALDIPTQEEIDDVIREAEQILSDAVFDDQNHTTFTREAPSRDLFRDEGPGVLDGCGTNSRTTSTRTTHVPWARSPPPPATC